MCCTCQSTVGDAGAGVWGVVGGRVLRVSVCRRGVLKPWSTVEGGDESVRTVLGLKRRPKGTAIQRLVPTLLKRTAGTVRKS